MSLKPVMFRHFLFLLSCSLLSAEDLSQIMARAVNDGGIPGVGQIQFAPDTISKPAFAGTLSVESKAPPKQDQNGISVPMPRP
jgi:hypothetical protein